MVNQQVFFLLWLEAIPVTWDTAVQAYEALSATQHVVHAINKNNANASEERRLCLSDTETQGVSSRGVNIFISWHCSCRKLPTMHTIELENMWDLREARLHEIHAYTQAPHCRSTDEHDREEWLTSPPLWYISIRCGFILTTTTNLWYTWKENMHCSSQNDWKKIAKIAKKAKKAK